MIKNTMPILSHSLLARLLSLIATTLVLLGIPAVSVADAHSQATLKQVTLQLQWKHQFEFAGFYAAKEKGYYQQAGLAVELVEAGSNSSHINDLVEGRTSFMTRGSIVIGERLQGAPVVMLSNYFKRSPLVIVSKPEIRLPGDLKGKRLMAASDEIDSIAFKTMFKQFGVSKAELSLVAPTFTIQDFISGRVDAMTVFLTNEIFALQQSGVPYNVIDPNNYDVEFYDVNLVTSESYARANPEAVRAFKAASDQGWVYALAHQEEIIDLILRKYNSQNRSRAALEFEAKQTARLMLPKVYPVGGIDGDKLRRMGESFVQAGEAPSIDRLDGLVIDGGLGGKPQTSLQLRLMPEERAYLRKKGDIRMCVDPDWMPVERIGSDGKHQGVAADLTQRFAQKLGVKLVLVPSKTWQETMDLFNAHQCDIISAAAETSARKATMDFTTPYMFFSAAIITNNRQVYIPDLQSVLKETFGVVKGYSLGEKLRLRYPGIRLVEVKNTLEGLKQVQEGKLFGFIDALPAVVYLIQTQGMYDIKVAGQLDEKWEISLATRNDEPLLRHLFQLAIDAVPLEERQNAINRWLSVRVEQGFDYALMWKLGLGAALLLLGVIVWNRKLAKLNKRLDLAQRQLVQSLATVQSILDTSPVGISLLDAQLRHTHVNKAYWETSGYELDELLGQSIMEFFPPGEALEPFIQEATRTLAAGKPISQERQLRHRDGSLRWVLIQVNAVDPRDLEQGFVVVVENISRRKQAEREILETNQTLQATLQDLRATQAQLIQAEKMVSLGQLVTSVAHELNSPIGAVKSCGQSIAAAFAELKVKLPILYGTLDQAMLDLFMKLVGHTSVTGEIATAREQRAAMVEVARQLKAAGISDARARAAVLIQLNAQTTLDAYLPLLRHPEVESILATAQDFAAIDNGTLVIGMAVARVNKIVGTLRAFSPTGTDGGMMATDLEEGIKAVLALYQSQIAQQAELVCEFEPIAPIYGQPEQLNQLWTHLILNALQAMKQKGRLTVTLKQIGNEVVVSVGDTGCGIPDEIRGRIFEPFFTTRAAGEGAGLGLDAVKKIVEKHRGRIEVQSEEGVGSMFLVYLPKNKRPNHTLAA